MSAPSNATSRLPTLHRRLGAELAPYRGAEAPAAYGDQAAELAALRAACGLVDLPWMAGLEMLGEDRVRFLNGLVTCDVKGLEPGRGAYGFVTSLKGRVMADLAVLALDDRLWLELPASVAGPIAEHLLKYVIVDRVEIRPLDGVIPLGLVGPRSAEVLGAGELPEADFGHLQIRLCGAEVRAVREPPLGEVPAWTLWVPATRAGDLFEQLLERGAAHALRPVGHRALDRLRLEAGRPLFGVDFGPDHFPQETGLEAAAVSYDKGCYLGQEVVARIHYRGGVNRHLRGLMGSGAPPDDLVGREVSAGGRAAGTVTSAAPADGGWLGLAILHRRAEPGAEGEIAGGAVARVVEPPFAGGPGEALS